MDPYLQSNGHVQAQEVRDQDLHGQPTTSFFEPINSVDKWSISLANALVETNSSVRQHLRKINTNLRLDFILTMCCKEQNITAFPPQLSGDR